MMIVGGHIATCWIYLWTERKIKKKFCVRSRNFPVKKARKMATEATEKSSIVDEKSENVQSEGKI